MDVEPTKKCPRCREEKPETCFSVRKASVDGRQPSCKTCVQKSRRSAKGAWERYKSRAKEKGWAFELSEADFEECALSTCAYCGDGMERAAFDRTDSSRGYVLDNVVPCCSMCNYMKNKFPEDDFFTKVFKIAMVFDPPDQVQRDLVARYPNGHEHVFDINEDYVLEVRLRYTGPVTKVTG